MGAEPESLAVGINELRESTFVVDSIALLRGHRQRRKRARVKLSFRRQCNQQLAAESVESAGPDIFVPLLYGTGWLQQVLEHPQ